MNMYFIAIVCPEEINRQILRWKLWMKERFGCEAAIRSPAHITLIPPCWMKPELETSLVSSLDTFALTRQKFNVQLSGFSNFKPRVIFVHVTQNKTLEDLQRDLSGFLHNENKYPFIADDRTYHPHVTIATRDLHKKSYYEAWENFKEKKYETEWLVEGVSLLRHNKKNWDVVATSQFN